MIFGVRPLEELDENELLELVENKVAESRSLDFKRDIIGRDDTSKREFLKDVSALANTSGGNLIIGMDEDDGVASELCGISPPSIDTELLRLESMLQDGIEPRLIGARLRAIAMSSGRWAVVVRVQASWNSPHRVIYQRWNKFFARNSAGVYEPSVEQLRDMFLRATEIERQFQNFRTHRNRRIVDAESNSVQHEGHIALHITPVQPAGIVDISKVFADPAKPFGLIGSASYNSTTNFDGYIVRSQRSEDGRLRAYTQLYRNGTVEAVRSAIVRRARPEWGDQVLPFLVPLVSELVGAVKHLTLDLVTVGQAPPFMVGVSLIHVNGTYLWQPGVHPEDLQINERWFLEFEPFLIEDVSYQPGWQTVLRPVLDAWWNSYGLPRCAVHFDADGRWR